jgi:hypothetical protein
MSKYCPKSLAYLFVNVLLFSVAFALTRHSMQHTSGTIALGDFVLFSLMMTCYGAAVGGLAGRMTLGGIIGLMFGIVLWFITLPPAVRQ